MQAQYEVKWCDRDSSENTWEYSNNLYCEEQVEAFEKAQKKKLEALEPNGVESQSEEDSDSLIECIDKKKMVNGIVSFTYFSGNFY